MLGLTVGFKLGEIGTFAVAFNSAVHGSEERWTSRPGETPLAFSTKRFALADETTISSNEGWNAFCHKALHNARALRALHHQEASVAENSLQALGLTL
jgi:hypothetical protein